MGESCCPFPITQTPCLCAHKEKHIHHSHPERRVSHSRVWRSESSGQPLFSGANFPPDGLLGCLILDKVSVFLLKRFVFFKKFSYYCIFILQNNRFHHDSIMKDVIIFTRPHYPFLPPPTDPHRFPFVFITVFQIPVLCMIGNR